MSKKQNSITPFLRQCVNLWLAGWTKPEFTVTDVSTGLYQAHTAFIDVDMTKAISNELVRLETRHKLVSRRGVKGVDGSGIGRPPRVYRKLVMFKA